MFAWSDVQNQMELCTVHVLFMNKYICCIINLSLKVLGRGAVTG